MQSDRCETPRSIFPLLVHRNIHLVLSALRLIRRARDGIWGRYSSSAPTAAPAGWLWWWHVSLAKITPNKKEQEEKNDPRGLCTQWNVEIKEEGGVRKMECWQMQSES